MRKVAVVVMSTLVVALMLAQPASASLSKVYVTDKLGDTGHCGVDIETGDIVTLWQGDSPLMNADYLDITASWLTLKKGQLTAGMKVASSITVENGLPTGVKEIWYTWFFYVETGAEHFNADYGLHVCWDGDEFYAFVADRGPPYSVMYIEAFEVDGDEINVVIDANLVQGATAWFFESIVWMISPADDDILSWCWYWYCADITDWDGTTMLPWLPMP
jgi:hypothetical protein